MATRSTEQLEQIIRLADDNELIYRTRFTAVKLLRAGYRDRYQLSQDLSNELNILVLACRSRGLLPFEGGWYEMTSPSELGRWL